MRPTRTGVFATDEGVLRSHASHVKTRLRRAREILAAGIRDALRLEYRFTARAMEHGDFLEGIRAQIIDRDRNPQWKHRLDSLGAEAAAMLAPLGAGELTF